MKDADFKWLLDHLPAERTMPEREELATNIVKQLERRLKKRALPYTLGIFGGWGCGKTTILAQIAKGLQRVEHTKVIYFNAWKYAGLMEIVPALIYKLLKQGIADTEANRDKAAKRVLLSLGKEYSDKFGEWVEEWIGVDAVKLFKDVHQVATKVGENRQVVPEEIVKAYYTQLDRAQDVLADALGDLTSENPPKDSIVVLVDELDRCDPDEAFNVIKQLRVLFTMRRVPIAFVIAANPEPIGLAIKHRYGLESIYGDYEARRILEKFVDAYEDLGGTTGLSLLLQNLWGEYFNANPSAEPWIFTIDAADDFGFDPNDVWNGATCYDSMDTSIPLYSNLRVLRKSFEYVRERLKENRHLIWTSWHLEIATQVDPHFRRELRLIADNLKHIARDTYKAIGSRKVTRISGSPKHYAFQVESHRSMFAYFRQHFWELAKACRSDLVASRKDDPEEKERSRILEKLLQDPKRMQFVMAMLMVPINNAIDLDEMVAQAKGGCPSGLEEDLMHQIGYQIATY